MSGPQRKHNYASLTVKEALSKLLTTLETVELRKGLQPHEKKRAQCALFLTQQSPQPEETKADERRENHRRFLKKINEKCGPEPVIVSAIGLGQTAIGCMVEFYRLRLPSEIKKPEKYFKSELLQVLAQEAQGNQANPEALHNFDCPFVSYVRSKASELRALRNGREIAGEICRGIQPTCTPRRHVYLN